MQHDHRASSNQPARKSGNWIFIAVLAIAVFLIWKFCGTSPGGSEVVEAKPDEPDPILVPAGYQVTPWLNRAEGQVDGWIPFRFEFKPRHEIERIEFQLTVKTLPQIPETDTFHGMVDGKPYNFKNGFSDCVQQEPKVISIEIKDKAVLKQVQTGLLRCCLQDDTFLYKAEMIVYYE